MKNEIQIKPLLKFELSFYDDDIDVFTADQYLQDENSLIFYRTGNVIRQYFVMPNKMIVSPVDNAEIPE